VKYRIGVDAFVSDRFEHSGGERVKLAMNRVFSRSSAFFSNATSRRLVALSAVPVACS